jgi:hypothetical protein
VVEILSEAQDGRAFEDLLQRMHLRPLAGSGWKVVIINEVGRMAPQAEVMWLDGLRMEKLPAKTVVVFTTNNLHKLTDRFIRRCEVQRFDATSDAFPRRHGGRGSPGLEAGDRDRPGHDPAGPRQVRPGYRSVGGGTVPWDVLQIPTDDSILWAGKTADVRGSAVADDGLVVLHRGSVEGISADGRSLWTVPLPSPPVRWGVALTANECVVTLSDGLVLCLAGGSGHN